MLIFGSSRIRTITAIGALVLGIGLMLLAPLYGFEAIEVLILGLLVSLTGGAIRLLEDEVKVWADGTWIRHWGLMGRAIGGRGDLVGVVAERYDGGAAYASYEHTIRYRLVFRFRGGRDVRIRPSRSLKQRLGLPANADAPSVAAAINGKLGLDPLRLRVPAPPRPVRQTAHV